MSKPTIICLTPVKNEAWILDRFLKCASLWADHIIIADQQSTDNSKAIALSYPKVTLIENPSSTYSEQERQKLLLDAARQIPGPRLLIALDADEILSSNYMYSPEWETICQAKPGTVIKFKRIELFPDLRTYYTLGIDYAWGFMDDGSESMGRPIHSPRIPDLPKSPKIILRDISVLHYQCTNWERMKSKRRWYICWERLNQAWRRPIDIHRQYTHMETVSQDRIFSVLPEWFHGYQAKGIDMTSIQSEPIFWWDLQILELFEKHGANTFKRDTIWDIDYTKLAKSIDPDKDVTPYADPRHAFDRYVHQWLQKSTQATKLYTRFLDKALKYFGY